MTKTVDRFARMEKNMKVRFDTTLERYIVCDTNTGEVVDDANGHGFKTRSSAMKAMWYKENKDKVYESSVKVALWWKSHKQLADMISMEIFDSRDTIEEILDRHSAEFGSAPLDKMKMYKYYDSSMQVMRRFNKKKH